MNATHRVAHGFAVKWPSLRQAVAALAQPGWLERDRPAAQEITRWALTRSAFARSAFHRWGVHRLRR